jgi:hypothetical protein
MRLKGYSVLATCSIMSNINAWPFSGATWVIGQKRALTTDAHAFAAESDRGGIFRPFDNMSPCLAVPDNVPAEQRLVRLPNDRVAAGAALYQLPRFGICETCHAFRRKSME